MNQREKAEELIERAKNLLLSIEKDTRYILLYKSIRFCKLAFEDKKYDWVIQELGDIDGIISSGSRRTGKEV